MSEQTNVNGTPSTIERDAYGQITRYPSPKIRIQVADLVAQVSKNVDEHGNWNFGIQATSRGGRNGAALNWDCYAVGSDLHTGDFLAVIQIRQTRWNKYGNSSRKSYYLIGRNEDATAFAHCVESRTIHAAIADGRDVIRACQTWMFGTEYAKVLRQGDIALVPVRSPKGDKTDERAMSIGSSHGYSHLLICEEVHRNGSIYVLNPTLTHNPGTHSTLRAKGWHKVVTSNRAAQWDFSKVKID